MSLSGGSWERFAEGPGGGRDGVIALRTIREIAFSDCARPRQSPVSLHPSLSVPTVCGLAAAGDKTWGPRQSRPSPPRPPWCSIPKPPQQTGRCQMGTSKGGPTCTA